MARQQAVLSLLLAIPAFLAAALGRGISSESLPRTSLACFYGLWAIVFSSLGGIVLFLADVNRHAVLNFKIEVFGHTHSLNWLWVALSLLAIVTYMILRKEKSDHRKYYLDILGNAKL